MEELIKQIVAKTGINEAQARSSAETVIGFLKSKLPSAIGDHLDSALGSAAGALGNVDLSSVTQGLGGLFGKK